MNADELKTIIQTHTWDNVLNNSWDNVWQPVRNNFKDKFSDKVLDNVWANLQDIVLKNDINISVLDAIRPLIE